MQTNIHERFRGRSEVRIAEDVLRSCVHCGFCNPACPTYGELNDERDGPRGRIYLLKQFLETGEASEATQRHLDRCLTCRACETACPSGVRYGRLADIGRDLLEAEVPRPFSDRLVRRLLRFFVPRPGRFGALMRAGRWLKPLLPRHLGAAVPPRNDPGRRPERRHGRTVILLGGCVQSVATPRSNAAAARVLDRLGITALEPAAAGCCGALSYHLSAQDEARAYIRRNLDAWAPELAAAEAVVSCSSGCGAMLKDYGELMRDDPDYAELARQVSEKLRDPAEILAAEDLRGLQKPSGARTALHCPCTLTHALRVDGALRDLLERTGVRLVETREDHRCCGSAGTYSILQPGLSTRLLERKLEALSGDGPERIVTANVGCQLHLGKVSPLPVSHWIELFDPEETPKGG